MWPALLEAVVEKTGYLAELRASHDPQDETRIENLAELVAVAREFDENRAETGEVATLEDFLEQVSLVADADQIPDGEEARGGQGVVTLMTLHTAKGLEFPVVFLTGMEDGTFPHMRALADNKRARGGAPAGLRRHHPRPRAAAPVAGGGARRLGRRRSTTRPAGSSTRSPSRPGRLAAHRAPRRSPPAARPPPWPASPRAPACARPATGR